VAAARILLARASIYVHPARYEPFGLAILDAALAGCALVLGDIPSLRELWHDAAIFVPTEDAARLSRELTALIENGDRRLR
jgi:glycosyltransferase involved in cell wall biosynthesis